ncbi:MAG: hypothetical protein ABJE95_16525 [Byssovorax sp.]
MRTRGSSLIGVLVATLSPASAFAVDPPKPPPVESPVDAPKATPATPPVKAVVAKAAAPKPPEATPLPPPPVRAWMVASVPQGPWTLRIDNEGDKPLRVPADVRLLRFEIESEPYLAPAEPVDPKPKKWTKPKPPAKAVTCKIPAPLRPDAFPDSSALLLRPGESYVESFDPRLFCFGKDAAARLAGGAVVHAFFGWEARKQPAWSAKKKPDGGPFVVESTVFPPDTMPLRELTAPTMVLSYGSIAKPPPADPVAATPTPASPPAAAAKPIDPSAAPPKPADPAAADPDAPLPPVVDENAPRFELTTTPFVDASSTSRAAVTITATNAGHRPMLVAIHQRMIGIRIDGPDGVLRCGSMPATHGIPRELYRTLNPGASTSITLILSEGCTRDAMRRPGLYRVTATLNANESGSELGIAAFTGKARTKEPSLVRVLSGPDPFYAVAPHAVPTPKPLPPLDGDE